LLRRHVCVGFCAFIVTIVYCSWAFAQVPQKYQKKKTTAKDPITGFAGDTDLGATYNGLGLRFRLFAGYQWRLYPHKNRALENNFIRVGPFFSITPANIGVGGFIRIQPMSILNFGASYRYQLYFPLFTSGVLFKNLDAVHKAFKGVDGHLDGQKRINQQLDNTIKDNGGKRVFVHGQVADVQGTFQVIFKGVLAVVNVRFMWLSMSYSDTNNSEIFFDPVIDTMINKEDVVLNLTALLGYELKPFRFVLANTYIKAYGSGEFNWSAGPGVQWQMTEKFWKLRQPSLLFLTRWFIDHRYRLGAFPNIAVLFTATM